MISVGLTYFLEKLIEKNFIDNSSSHYLNKNFKKYTPERRVASPGRVRCFSI